MRTLAFILCFSVVGVAQTHYSAKTLADTSNNTRNTTSWKTIGRLECNLCADEVYTFKAWVYFSSAATSTGIGLRANYSGSVTTFSATGRAPLAGDGNAGIYWATITTPADSMVSTAVVAQNTTYMALIEGIIVPSAAGALQIQFETEIAGSAVTIKKNSNIEVWRRD